MAYMNQEKKATIKANLDKALKGTGVKYSLSVNNHSTIVCTVKSAPIDLVENFIQTDVKSFRGKKMDQSQIDYIRQRQYLDVNPYWYKEHFSGKALELVDKIVKAMYTADYYDNSDPQTDYFNTAYYVDVNIGKWNKPFEVK
jgi:hypothetical protein